MTSWKRPSRAFGLLSVAFITLFSSGCIGRHVLITQPGITCLEAQRLAIEAVRRMGYTVTDSTKPTPGTPGKLVASRGEGEDQRGMLVTVTCTRLGAEVEAQAEGTVASAGTATEFQRTFQTVVANRPPPRAAAATGLDVILTPEPTGVDLGADVRVAEVLPVSVRISNRTPRRYQFRVEDAVLVTADGKTARPLDATTVASRLSPEAASAVQRSALHDQDVIPNSEITGYLFYPLSSYSRARVELLEPESQESEGFSIEF